MTLDKQTIRSAGTLRAVAASICTVALLAGCGGGGDVELDASSTTTINDNSTNTGGGGSSNPCANYIDPATNTRIQGTFDGTNCVYGPEFVGETTPLLVDLTIPFISGVHIFEDTLQVGEFFDDNATADEIPQDGEGPTLTIRAGNTITFTDPSDYVLINRGSRLEAVGTRSAPITFTGFEDAVLGSAGKEDVQLWGGIVLNGNGITNKCSDQERTDGTCSVRSEGKDSYYGGNNNAESSGTLRYVVIKHPGFEVRTDDELNGLTLNAVGSGTTIENVQVYSTYDDGIEFFGGAAEVENMVALYVKDDSIDWADGWVGSVTRALVIQPQTDGDRCIEADNQDGAFNALPVSSPTISNLTCIPSGALQAPAGPGTHGNSMGAEFRRGTQFALQDSIFYTGHAQSLAPVQTPGRCLRVTDTETAQRAQAGSSSVRSTVLACATPTSNGTNWTTVFTNGDSVANWVLNNGAGAYPANTDNRTYTLATPLDPDFRLLDGYLTLPAAQWRDLDGLAFTVTTVTGQLGAVTAADDWTSGWAIGLDDLWF